MSLKPLTSFERFIRFGLAVALLSWAIAGGPTWAYVGVLLLATASWGKCPLVKIL